MVTHDFTRQILSKIFSICTERSVQEVCAVFSIYTKGVKQANSSYDFGKYSKVVKFNALAKACKLFARYIYVAEMIYFHINTNVYNTFPNYRWNLRSTAPVEASYIHKMRNRIWKLHSLTRIRREKWSFVYVPFHDFAENKRDWW